MTEPSLCELRVAAAHASERRAPWERLWRDCYAYAMPLRGHGLGAEFEPASRMAERMFDGTAADAVEQLSASLLAQLTPPWSRWFGLRPGQAIPPRPEAGALAERLDGVADIVQGHFDRSNFAVEMHQCFLDLATVGTATLMFQETGAGAVSAFRFAAVPASEMFIEDDQQGGIGRVFRRSSVTPAGLRKAFPDAAGLAPALEKAAEGGVTKLTVVEAISPGAGQFDYAAFLAQPLDGASDCLLAKGRFEHSPFIVFRWLKGAGEVYGRSPVMTALPDIKTANKVVELILKNASIAVTGIWLADDDGVLNPANIRLTPGSIIPKAPGSAGLTPLQAPGRFDVSELVLADLRARIRHTLLVDRLAPVDGPRMTATEVAERSSETARLLGAVYGRLQGELLTPLLVRALGILRRRGEIGEITLDGRLVDLQWRSPLARAQAREDVRNTMLWLEQVTRLGPAAAAVVDVAAAARWLARSLGVPGEIVLDDPAAGLALLLPETGHVG
jgi:hypothetical protein